MKGIHLYLAKIISIIFVVLFTSQISIANINQLWIIEFDAVEHPGYGLLRITGFGVGEDDLLHVTFLEGSSDSIADWKTHYVKYDTTGNKTYEIAKDNEYFDDHHCFFDDEGNVYTFYSPWGYSYFTVYIISANFEETVQIDFEEGFTDVFKVTNKGNFYGFDVVYGQKNNKSCISDSIERLNEAGEILWQLPLRSEYILDSSPSEDWHLVETSSNELYFADDHFLAKINTITKEVVWTRNLSQNIQALKLRNDKIGIISFKSDKSPLIITEINSNNEVLFNITLDVRVGWMYFHSFDYNDKYVALSYIDRQFNINQEEKIIMTKNETVIFNETDIISSVNMGHHEDRIYFTSTEDFYFMNYEVIFEDNRPILNISQISYNTINIIRTISASFVSGFSFLVIATLIFLKKRRRS